MRNGIITVIIIICIFFNGCVKTNDDAKVIEIGERMFVTQINDIYLNAREYLGKPVKLEGIFKIDHSNEEPFFYVIRYFYDECCGIDNMAGFEVRGLGLSDGIFPDDDSWVEAFGILRELTAERQKTLYIELSSLNVLAVRGNEHVRQ